MSDPALDDLIATLRGATPPPTVLATARTALLSGAPRTTHAHWKLTLLAAALAFTPFPTGTPSLADDVSKGTVPFETPRSPRYVQVATAPAAAHAPPRDVRPSPRPASSAAPSRRAAKPAVDLGRVPRSTAAVVGAEDPRFELAVALYERGMHYASALVFETITREGAAHPRFGDVLPWIARLDEHLEEPSILIEMIGRYGRADIARFGTHVSPRGYQRLVFLRARERYEARDLSGAVALFREVRASSELYPEAKLYEGVTHVRMRRARPAIAAFRAVLAADDEELHDLAWLNLGRVYYTIAHQSRGRGGLDARVLGSAIEAWDRIPETSPHWPDAIFEESWALFVSDEHARALGRIHALESPYLEGHHHPEALVLRAVILFQRCQTDAAEDTVDLFHRKFDALHADLRTVLDAHADSPRAHGLARSLRRGDAGLRPRTAHILRSTLSDREIDRHLAATANHARELRTLPTLAADATIGPYVDFVRQELTIAQALAVDRAGELARTRMSRLVEDLQEQMNAMDAVQLEIHTERRRRPRGYPPGGDAIRIVADQEHVIWPFDGEYWEDEIPYYRVHVPDRCTR